LENQQLLYGRKLRGRYVAVTQTQVATAAGEDRITKPGEVYEYLIQTQDTFNDEEAIAQLLQLETQRADLKIECIETAPKQITLQVRDIGPGGWVIGGLFSLIVPLFAIVAIVIMAVFAWQLLEQQPGLFLLGVISVGVILFFQSFKISAPSSFRSSSSSTSSSKQSKSKLTDREVLDALKDDLVVARDEKSQARIEEQNLSARIKKEKDAQRKQELETRRRAAEDRMNAATERVKELIDKKDEALARAAKK
jgi:hypothetical protein